MDCVRLGYVGCGFMGQKVHLHNFTALPDCEVVALAEVRKGLGQRVQDRFGIHRLYGNHLEMSENLERQATYDHLSRLWSRL